MYLMSVEGYKTVEVDFLKTRKTDEIWVSMKHIHDGLGVKNMPDLVLKEIYGKDERKNFPKNETKKYKMTEREIFGKYDNLGENELNRKDNKKFYVRNIISSGTCIAEVKKRGERNQVDLEKK